MRYFVGYTFGRYISPNENFKYGYPLIVFQNSAADHAKEYLESLARLSENQLLQYDNMLIVDDVIKGRKYLSNPDIVLQSWNNLGDQLLG